MIDFEARQEATKILTELIKAERIPLLNSEKISTYLVDVHKKLTEYFKSLN